MWLSVVLLAVLVPVWSCDLCTQVLSCPGAYRRSPVDIGKVSKWSHDTGPKSGQHCMITLHRYYTRSSTSFKSFIRWWLVLFLLIVWLTYFMYRLAMLHVMMWRTTPPCYKNSCNAIKLRPGWVLMSNASRSGGHPLLLAYCTDTIHLRFSLDASLTSSTWQHRLSSLCIPCQSTMMATLQMTTSLRT